MWEWKRESSDTTVPRCKAVEGTSTGDRAGTLQCGLCTPQLSLGFTHKAVARDSCNLPTAFASHRLRRDHTSLPTLN